MSTAAGRSRAYTGLKESGCPNKTGGSGPNGSSGVTVNHAAITSATTA
jgi:hypothetical protein